MAESLKATPSSTDLHNLPAAIYDEKLDDEKHVDVTTNSVNEDDSDIDDSVSAETEKADPLAGWMDDVLPAKEQGKKVRNLRHQIFTLYRRLFAIIFLTNLGFFIWYLSKGANANQVAGVVIANLFVSIVQRQDYIINTYFLITRIPKSWPFWIRASAARVYHIGGLHSGCGVSGTCWVIYYTGKATREYASRTGPISVATLVLTYIVMTFLIGIVALAHPTLRMKYHNSFEWAHRFLGWSTVGLVWGLIILITNDYKKPGETLRHAIVHNPHFWLVAILTFSIALSWMQLKKVNVRSEVLSEHCVRMYFDYVTPGAGSFTRLSTSPLFEWHSFATIPIPNQKGYSLIVSKAGDWTTKQIAAAPTRMWIRGVPTYGVLRIVPLFRKILFVATGSGIAPIAPWLFQANIPFRLFWTSPNVRQTFGDKLVNDIFQVSPDSVIYDTRIHGKPDMVKLTLRLVRDYQPEVVCVISNERLTRKIVYGMVSRGIPAFGPIWDS